MTGGADASRSGFCSRRSAVVTALRSEVTPARPASRRHGIGFWLAGYVFAVTMAFSAVPAPLYVLYQARDHFGSLMVTVIFSAYAFGVAASLFSVGHVSDWLGRRRILLIAVGVNMTAGLLFLGWPAVPGLIVGRVISRVSIGMLSATATAYLIGAREEENAWRDSAAFAQDHVMEDVLERVLARIGGIKAPARSRPTRLDRPAHRERQGTAADQRPESGPAGRHSLASWLRMTSSAKLPLTQANWRKVPSSTKPARVAAPIMASLSARVSTCSRCRPRMAKP